MQQACDTPPFFFLSNSKCSGNFVYNYMYTKLSTKTFFHKNIFRSTIHCKYSTVITAKCSTVITAFMCRTFTIAHQLLHKLVRITDYHRIFLAVSIHLVKVSFSEFRTLISAAFSSATNHLLTFLLHVHVAEVLTMKVAVS